MSGNRTPGSEAKRRRAGGGTLFRLAGAALSGAFAVGGAALLLAIGGVSAQTAETETPRDAGSLEGAAGYVGDEACTTCHGDILDAYHDTIHARVLTAENARTELMRRGCEACHGPGEQHVAAGGGEAGGPLWVTFDPEDDEGVDVRNERCLQCHSGGEQLHWPGSPHEAREVACGDCHQVMRQISSDALLARNDEVDTCAQCHVLQRSRTYHNAHMPLRPGPVAENWMSCSSCHNPHGTVTPSLIDAISVNDNCFSCHADKRGPHLWEHPPVQESCLNCHDPHGTINANMLKILPPRMCQTCHIATLHPSQPHAPDSRMVIGRSCTNCHQKVHGSNHPSGMFFTR